MSLADYAGKNNRSHYCKYCATPEGMLHPPQEHLKRLTAFIIEDEKLPEEKAREKAIHAMRKFPAWKGKV
jgi:hypothetical protein